MRMVSIKTPAKINLTLDVLSKREDGFHNIETVMQSVAIYDHIQLKERPGRKINLKVNTSKVPGGRANIGYSAAKLMLETFNIDRGLDIYIHKDIPVAAGMGGGSSDAAAIMVGICKLYDLDLPMAKLAELGRNIGADVPFCMMGALALAEGIGDRLTKLPTMEALHLVIVKPQINISTAQIYGLVDIERINRRPQNERFTYYLSKGDIISASQYGANVLEEITAKLYPEIYSIKSELKSLGALYALMSGSGPSVFGIFRDKNEASNAYRAFESTDREIFLTHTINIGPAIRRS